MAARTDVEVTRTAHLAASRLAHIKAMLTDAFDGDFTEEDWRHTMGGWHVIVSVDERITSHAAVVPRRIWSDGHWFDSGYVEGVATVADARRRGYGSIAVTAVTEVVNDRYEFGALSTNAHAFYAPIGWERWRGTTAVETKSGIVPTPDEDDGIMVLRFGPSATLDLTGEIRCESRPGDDW